MSYVRVPLGLSRSRVGKRIVYQSTLPGLKVKIWKKEDFDGFKENGRFPNIDREMLDFSIKKLNEPEDMDVDETTLECMDVDKTSQFPDSADVQGEYLIKVKFPKLKHC